MMASQMRNELTKRLTLGLVCLTLALALMTPTILADDEPYGGDDEVTTMKPGPKKVPHHHHVHVHKKDSHTSSSPRASLDEGDSEDSSDLDADYPDAEGDSRAAIVSSTTTTTTTTGAPKKKKCSKKHKIIKTTTTTKKPKGSTTPESETTTVRPTSSTSTTTGPTTPTSSSSSTTAQSVAVKAEA